MELTTEQPFWYLMICLVTGALFSYLLYAKDSLLSDVKTWVKVTMAALRFITISLLCFFLLSPFLKIISRQLEKPIIIIAQDNSESLLTGPDSAYYKKEYPVRLNALIADLKDKYDVKTFSFGDHIGTEINFKFNEKQTNIAALINEVNTRFSNRNVGALVLATDGLYNQGANPIYTPDNLKVPIFTLALGDTNVHKDLLLKKVNCNKIAYLGNNFPMEISLEARQCKGEVAVLTVQKDSVLLYKKAVNISNASFRTLLPLSLEASKKGMQHYKISVAPLEGEVSKCNNSKDVYIEVLERKQKILILADGAHPDISAIKQAIESSQSYEVNAVLAEKFDGLVNPYNLIVLHQLPSASHPVQTLMEKIKTAGIPVWFVLGEQTSLPAFNALQTGLSIQPSLSKINESLPVLSPDFSSFTLTEDLQKSFFYFPPLRSPFGPYKLNVNGTVMMKQQIGAIKTEQPLLLFTETAGTKNGILAGEGIWAWRLRNFAEKNNHDAVNELISKTVQYLSVKENKSHFRITGKNSFQENEPIAFEASVFNDLFEPVNPGEVQITIQNADKKKFPFAFVKTEKGYTLNAGMFPPGTYTYNARTILSGKTYTFNGIFSVSAIQAEASETVADHHLLYTLSQKTNGKMLFPNQMEMLKLLLRDNEEIKPVSYTEQKLTEMIHLKWVLFLLLALLATEWFLRKRNGAY